MQNKRLYMGEQVYASIANDNERITIVQCDGKGKELARITCHPETIENILAFCNNELYPIDLPF